MMGGGLYLDVIGQLTGSFSQFEKDVLKCFSWSILDGYLMHNPVCNEYGIFISVHRRMHFVPTPSLCFHSE
jgi:hypothetical protein